MLLIFYLIFKMQSIDSDSENYNVPHCQMEKNSKVLPSKLTANFEIELQKDKDSSKTMKAKKKYKWKTICTSSCKYDVVRRVARKIGLKEVAEYEPWIIFWTDNGTINDKCMEMKRFQKINHFPGMNEICRKDLLAKNLKRMKKLFPKEYAIYPKTWSLPADYTELLSFSRQKKNFTYICKPDTGCQGKGIFVAKTLKNINPTEKLIVQQYISKPFVIDGYKFDLRIYVLITAVDPCFRVYVYKDGLARFATVKYVEPNRDNVHNVFMHLTNYAVNKNSDSFVRDDEAGSKRKISSINEWWRNNGYDIDEIWKRIDDVILKTLISASATLKHCYRSSFPSHAGANACFEILGFDILLDHKLMPFVLEVNLSPSFHIDSSLDKEIKEGLITNTFQILNFGQCNPRRCIEEDRKKARIRLMGQIKSTTNSRNTKKHIREEEQTSTHDTILSLEIYELEHIGNFRLIYPTHSYTEKYEKYFKTNATLYQYTSVNRAREECARLERERSVNSKQESSTLLNKKTSLLPQNKISCPDSVKAPRNKTPQHIKIPNLVENFTEYYENDPDILSSSSSSLIFDPLLSDRQECQPMKYGEWEPQSIDLNAEEEKERIRTLTERENLIRGLGIAEEVKKLIGHRNHQIKFSQSERGQKANCKLSFEFKSNKIPITPSYLLNDSKKRESCKMVKTDSSVNPPHLEMAKPQKNLILSNPMFLNVRRLNSLPSPSLVPRSQPMMLIKDKCHNEHIRMTKDQLSRIQSNLNKLKQLQNLKNKYKVN